MVAANYLFTLPPQNKTKMNLISRATIEKVSSLNIVEVCERLGIEVKKEVIKSPYNSENTPSCKLYPHTCSYHCWSAGQGGGVISLVMQSKGLPYKESIEELCKLFGIAIEYEQGNANYEAVRERKQKAWLDNDHASKQYEAQRALIASYLAMRKIQEATAQKYRIGANAEFNNRVSYPITDIMGNIVGFTFGTTKGETPKYKNSATSEFFNKDKHFFGLDQARKSIAKNKTALIVEGTVDLLQSYQRGYENVIAVLGSALSESHCKALNKAGAEKIELCFDGDEAGKRATIRAMEIALKKGFAVYVRPLPNGCDPDSYLLTAETLPDRTDAVLWYAQYRMSKVAADDIQAQTTCLYDIKKMVDFCPDELLRTQYAKLLVQEMVGVIDESLFNDKKIPLQQPNAAAPRSSSNEQRTKEGKQADRDIKTGIDVKKAKEWLAEKTMPIQMLVGPIVVRGAINIVFGGAGAGKTTLMTLIADALSRGGSALGLPNEYGEPMKVYYFDLENSLPEFQERYRNSKGEYYEFSDNFLIGRPNESEYIAISFFDKIKAEYRKHHPDIIFIDNSSVMGGEMDFENTTVVKVFMNKLNAWRNMIGNITIVILGHTPKRYSHVQASLSQLAGSTMLANYAGNITQLVPLPNGLAYLITLKARSVKEEDKIKADGVLVVEASKDDNFLGFRVVCRAKEDDLIEPIDRKTQKDREDMMIAEIDATPIAQGINITEISMKYKMSRPTVYTKYHEAKKNEIIQSLLTDTPVADICGKYRITAEKIAKFAREWEKNNGYTNQPPAQKTEIGLKTEPIEVVNEQRNSKDIYLKPDEDEVY
jgi:DNA primase